MSHYGIVLVLFEGHAAVGRVRHALCEFFSGRTNGIMSGAGVVKKYNVLFSAFQSRLVVVVHDCAAGEHCAVFIGSQALAEVFPVHEVFTDGVSPVHISPYPVVGIVLAEKVVECLSRNLRGVNNKTVGVVYPSEGRGEMHERTEAEGFKFVCVIYIRPAPLKLFRVNVGAYFKRYLLSDEGRDVVAGVCSRVHEIKAESKVVKKISVFFYAHGSCSHKAAYGKRKVFFLNFHGNSAHNLTSFNIFSEKIQKLWFFSDYYAIIHYTHKSQHAQ